MAPNTRSVYALADIFTRFPRPGDLDFPYSFTGTKDLLASFCILDLA